MHFVPAVLKSFFVENSPLLSNMQCYSGGTNTGLSVQGQERYPLRISLNKENRPLIGLPRLLQVYFVSLVSSDSIEQNQKSRYFIVLIGTSY